MQPILTPGILLPKDGFRGQNLGHLFKIQDIFIKYFNAFLLCKTSKHSIKVIGQTAE